MRRRREREQRLETGVPPLALLFAVPAVIALALVVMAVVAYVVGVHAFTDTLDHLVDGM